MQELCAATFAHIIALGYADQYFEHMNIVTKIVENNNNEV